MSDNIDFDRDCYKCVESPACSKFNNIKKFISRSHGICTYLGKPGEVKNDEGLMSDLNVNVPSEIIIVALANCCYMYDKK